MKKLLSLLLLTLSGLLHADTPPNIIYILADDLGYGDVQCLNPERGKISTPHMDRVAAEGMTFTDAHTTSSVCTPTRYSIITGRYSWRTRLQQHVLNGYQKPLITPDVLTVPAFLKENGYATAMIGKWHLGLGIATLDGKPAKTKGDLREKLNKGAYKADELSNIDWSGTITGGPYDLGFSKWYGITASLDFPPYVWIRDNKWTTEGTHVKAFHRVGPAGAEFEAIEVLDKLAAESVSYIKESEAGTPFFAYIPLPSPHTPIVPTKKWQGKSGIGSYGDFVMQTDDFVGQIMAALEEKGISENTLLIVTSDNGCSRAAKFDKLEAAGHYASAQFRGSKSDIWEGGLRVPYLVKWPRKIKAGSVSDDTVCQADLLATCAEILGTELPAQAGVDSESNFPIFNGEAPSYSRKGIIGHSVSGHFSYREGKWKLILAYGSAGWTSPKEQQARKNKAPKAQLYDLEADPGEQNNLYLDHPEIAKRLLAHLTEDVESGSSVSGKEGKNDVEKIKLWKSEK